MCGAHVLTLKAIQSVAAMPYHAFDAHSGAHMLRADVALISPFLGCDAFSLPQPFFGPHPHAGMSAVTLLLPESEGGLINRDSLGDLSVIAPGDLHWTQAGRGMVHEEVPDQPGKAARGYQIFVNLTAAHKDSDPAALRVGAADMPLVRQNGGQVRVVAGEFDGAHSPITADPRWLTRVTLLDITVAAGEHIDVPVRAGDNAFFLVHSGVFEGLEPVAQDGPTAWAVFFERSGLVARIQAGSQGLRGVFFAGTPIDEPVVQHGPFTGNSAQDIQAYLRRYQAGEMGQLSR